MQRRALLSRPVGERVSIARVEIALRDARESPPAHEPLFNAVVCSPPYPGVYDYMAEARRERAALGAATLVDDHDDHDRHHTEPSGTFLGDAAPVDEERTRALWPTLWRDAAEIG